MPYRNTYGFPPYDPEKPGGGWSDEDWKRYRKQQRDRAQPWQFQPKSEQLASHERKRNYRIPRTIAQIDATLARNPLPPEAKPAPDGRKSGAQLAREAQVRRRAQLQAQRDRLQAELTKQTELANQRGVGKAGKAAPAATPNKATTPNPGAAPAATPAKATPGQNAYINVTTGVPIAKAAATAPASPGAIARAKQPIAFSGPKPPTVKALTPGEQAAINGEAGRIANGSAITNTGRSGSAAPRAKTPAAPTVNYYAVPGKGKDPLVLQRVSRDPVVVKTAPKKALPAQSKAVDQDREAARAKEQMANKLRASKAWSKTPKTGAPKGQKTGRQPMA